MAGERLERWAVDWLLNLDEGKEEKWRIGMGVGIALKALG